MGNAQAKQDLCTPELCTAAERGDPIEVQRLLSSKVNPNFLYQIGESTTTGSPLHHAVKNGHTDVVALLLGSRADPNIRTSINDTPAHYACVWVQPGCLRLILEARADPHATNHWRATPAQSLASSGMAALEHKAGLVDETIMLLRSYGADTSKTTRRGMLDFVLEPLDTRVGATCSATLAAEKGNLRVAAVLEQKSFGETRFKSLYQITDAPSDVEDLFSAIGGLVRDHATKHLPSAAGCDTYLQSLKREMQSKLGADTNDVGKVMQVVWTSSTPFGQKELCHILNGAIREDTPKYAAKITRALNTFCVTGRGKVANPVQWPPRLETFRGGGLPDHHRIFFVKGRLYRAPMVLPTSASLSTAEGFMNRQPEDKVMWTFVFDQERKCDHVNYVTNGVAGQEEEYIFAPYSVFTVQSVVWSDSPRAVPHKIQLAVAVDNTEHSDFLPLAPWC